jgi:hypothetical protein
MVAVAVLAASACGSQSHVQGQRAARLPRAVATSLAVRSDALAGALRRGDGCAARIQMHGLERQTRLAIAAGRVPAAYRTRLQAAVDDLAGRMPNCVPPPPPPPQPRPAPPPPAPPKKDKKHGKGEGHGKGPKKGPKEDHQGDEG